MRGDVERISGRNEWRQDLAQFAGRGIAEGRQGETDRIAKIERESLERAGLDENGCAAFRARSAADEQLRDVDQLFERVNDHNARVRDLGAHQVIVAGQCARVSRGGLARSGAAAGVEEDDGLAASASVFGKRQKTPRLAE